MSGPNMRDNLWAAFCEDAQQRLKEMEEGLRVLGTTSDERAHLVWRGAHALCGNAGMMGCLELAAFAGLLERVIKPLTDGIVTEPGRATVSRAVRYLRESIERVCARRAGDLSPDPALVAELGSLGSAARDPFPDVGAES